MERTETWNAQVEAVKDKYAARIDTLMQEIASHLREAGYTVEGPDFWDCDDYRWNLLARLASEVGDAADDTDVDVTLILCESSEYDGTEAGITFRLDIVEVGGRILGGMSPYNYTDDCWVPLADESAIEERFRLFENNMDPADVQAVIEGRGE